MLDPLQLQVFEKDHPFFETPLDAPLELGRQQGNEPEPYQLLSTTQPRRLIIASKKEDNVFSRQHVLLEPLDSGLVRVTNRGKAPLKQEDGTALESRQTAELNPPFSLVIATRRFSVSVRASLLGLDHATLVPSRLEGLCSNSRPFPSLAPVQLNELIGWLQTTMAVLQSTVGSADFLSQAARALVEIVGLHSGRVLLRDNNTWMVAAAHGAPADVRWQPSQRVLERLLLEKRTFWQHAQQTAAMDTPSLQPLQLVVASPILNGAGEVLGVLYGERRKEGPVFAQAGGKMEALMVELLACGVATGLVRQEQERSLLKAQFQFEQFFTPQLARQLRQEPDLLDGRGAEVTLLFCDVRNFSSFSAKIGPASTVQWIGNVMTELSRCVLAEEGVLVDYIGDELMAMWGAPAAQPDQAVRAVRAAVAMVHTLAGLNKQWEKTLGASMDLGIGLNTGVAQVGNTGSEFKFKYGPLGDPVNVASRVQGLTKYLKSRLLVTADTRRKLGPEFIARRVVKTRLVNIPGEFDLYEVELAGNAERRVFFLESEAALNHLEAGRFIEAARSVGALLRDHPGDGPLLLVLARAANMLVQDGPWDPVWIPPGK